MRHSRFLLMERVQIQLPSADRHHAVFGVLWGAPFPSSSSAIPSSCHCQYSTSRDVACSTPACTFPVPAETVPAGTMVWCRVKGHPCLRGSSLAGRRTWRHPVSQQASRGADPHPQGASRPRPTRSFWRHGRAAPAPPALLGTAPSPDPTRKHKPHQQEMTGPAPSTCTGICKEALWRTSSAAARPRGSGLVPAFLLTSKPKCKSHPLQGCS